VALKQMLCGSNASGFVAINALVLTGLANFRMVGYYRPIL